VGITDPHPNQAVDWWIFLREGKYKYIRTLRENEIEELYDLEADPHELTNLALSASYQKMLSQFREKLTEELKTTNAKLVDHWPSPKVKLSSEHR
jgi:arylsulfatase A-like enzyme